MLLRGPNIRFGSLANMARSQRDVRFTPNSRHCSDELTRPLCARSGQFAELLDLPRPDSAELCRIDASHDNVVRAPVRTELNDGFTMNHSTFLSNVLVWIGIAFCITQSAIFSGLNLAIFSINKLRLEVEAAGGNRDALGLLALRKDSNLTLATVLWGNVTINVLLTLLS